MKHCTYIICFSGKILFISEYIQFPITFTFRKFNRHLKICHILIKIIHEINITFYIRKTLRKFRSWIACGFQWIFNILYIFSYTLIIWAYSFLPFLYILRSKLHCIINYSMKNLSEASWIDNFLKIIRIKTIIFSKLVNKFLHRSFWDIIIKFHSWIRQHII